MDADIRAGEYIRAQGLAKWFGTEDALRCVLSDVTLDIKRGEIVSIIGRSGVGKSTLLRLLGGLIEPDEGSVFVEGKDVAAARAAKQFGLMPQSPALFPWRNVLQNVALPAEVNRGQGAPPLDPIDALDAVDLRERAYSLPHELSGGMKQRVAMARALATHAPVLLMDEPFSALDESTRDELYDEVLRIWNDGAHTLIMVTHNITEALLLSDRIVVLAGSPGTVADIVDVGAERPRVEAIDSGAFASTIARLRTALQESVA